MFGLIKLNNIGDKTSLLDKLQNYEVVGVYYSISEIEKKYKNYFAHKYRLMDYSWCYFSQKQSLWNKDIDSHKLSDMVIIDLEYDKEYIFDYQIGTKSNFPKEILREIKLTMIL
jgi:hypothetical protein